VRSGTSIIPRGGGIAVNVAKLPEIFPKSETPPWSVQELDAGFVVVNSAGQKLAFERRAGASISGHVAEPR
jgi:hypothetical protein